MKEKKKVTNKIFSVYCFIVYAMPLLILIYFVIATIFSVKGTGVTPSTSIVSNLTDLIYSILGDFYNGSICQAWGTLLTKFGLSTSAPLYIIVSGCFGWFTVATVVSVALNFFMIIPNMCNKIMNKWGD